MNRGDGPNGQPYTLQNVNVNSNWVTQYTGYAAGIVIEGSGYDNSVYTSWNNQFGSNTWYLMGNSSTTYFYWMGYPMTLTSFSAALVAETSDTGSILTPFPNGSVEGGHTQEGPHEGTSGLESLNHETSNAATPPVARVGAEFSHPQAETGI